MSSAGITTSSPLASAFAVKRKSPQFAASACLQAHCGLPCPSSSEAPACSSFFLWPPGICGSDLFFSAMALWLSNISATSVFNLIMTVADFPLLFKLLSLKEEIAFMMPFRSLHHQPGSHRKTVHDFFIRHSLKRTLMSRA
eukprot:TRINITY_DN19651_c0_g2_i1.p1 TRINITY_DN19651_c0_g2~~TRINITY_DN19651_c0_g2_i1.p1  ORF type:complete len:141 (-),score=6.13 TRINITY_DN19651_c0_g2_i1:19-441(-)